jgi:hypothetical protein
MSKIDNLVQDFLAQKIIAFGYLNVNGGTQ